MSEGYTITVQGADDATRQVLASVAPAQLNAIVAKAAADHVEGHLKDRDHTHANVMGGRRSHFYWNAAQTVTGEATGEGAVVVIDWLGLRQRWLGGDIYPINARKLAIPARRESYGIRPRDFPGDLKVVKFRSGAMALVKDEQTHTIDESGAYTIRSAEAGERKTRKKTVGLVEYWLVDHVYQRPDPTVLPLPGELLNAVTGALQEHFAE